MDEETEPQPGHSGTSTTKANSGKYLKFARHLITEEAYEKSFEFYLMAFESNPVLVGTHSEEFLSLLQMLTSSISSRQQLSLLYKILYRAAEVYCTNPDMLNEIGKLMYKYHFHDAAWGYFEIVLSMNPNYVNAEKNLNSIKNLLVERWHFRMLNDHIRNEYYRKALKDTVKVGDKVLDVGTGTGLLAIYAQEVGAEVTACDGSDVMSDMAKTIITKNKLKNIQIITAMSVSMEIRDKNQLYNLLVTEMFDAALFGEHILQMLYHAWPALLNPSGQVVPNKAEFFITVVECDHLSKKYQLTSDARGLLNIDATSIHVMASYTETYDCEDVHLIKEIKYLTDSASIVKVDFNDIKNIEQNLLRKEPYQMELQVKQSGNANMVVGWFNLYLTDEVTLTSNPLADNRANAWQQAVFFNKIPKQVNENEIINLEFFIKNGQVKMTTDTDQIITKVSPEVIRFLNDAVYMKAIDNCVNEACEKFADCMSQVIIADLSPFPYFGFQMLMRGAKSLLCCARNDEDVQFITDVFNENHIDLSSLTIVFGDQWSSEIFGKEKYHAVFAHHLDVCGDIDLHLLDVASHLLDVHLREDGIFMPHDMKVVGQLVSSHWLDINNKVYDENVSNYKIANTINKYQVTQNFCLDLSMLRYVPISDPVEVCSHPNTLDTVSVPVPIINDGFANAIVIWYNIQLTANSEKLTTNRPESFVEGMLYLTNCKLSLEAGKSVFIEQHKDDNGGFKLALAIDKT